MCTFYGHFSIYAYKVQITFFFTYYKYSRITDFKVCEYVLCAFFAEKCVYISEAV